MARLYDGSYVCGECEPEKLEVTAAPIAPSRPFLLVLLLGMVTLGLYFIWYNWIVFKEFDERTGRRHHGNIFLLGLFFIASAFGYALLTGGKTGWPEESWANPAPTVYGLFLLSDVMWALYLWLELGHLVRPLRELDLPPLPPRVLLPGLIVIHGVLSFGLQNDWMDAFFGLMILGSFFLVHSALSGFWAHKPSNDSAPASFEAASNT